MTPLVDSLDLGCWAAAGAQKTLAVGLDWLPAALLGTVTTAGGVPQQRPRDYIVWFNASNTTQVAYTRVGHSPTAVGAGSVWEEWHDAPFGRQASGHAEWFPGKSLTTVSRPVQAGSGAAPGSPAWRNTHRTDEEE